MEDKSNTAIALLGIIVLVLVIVAIVVYLNNKPEQEIKEGEEEIRFYDVTLTATSNNKRVYDVSYVFTGEGIRKEGVLKENVIEQVLELPSNRTYPYAIKNAEYYDFIMDCEPEKQVCNAELIKYPELFMDIMKLEEKYFKVFVYVTKGSVKEPFICVSENTMRLTNQEFRTGDGEELVKVETPSRLRLYYDTCYGVYSREYVESELRKSLAKEYEHDIEAYNKKNRARYEGFEEINFTDSHVRSYRETQKEGFYSFDLTFQIDPNFGYEETSEVRILMGDLYDSGELRDDGLPDKTRGENLKV